MELFKLSNYKDVENAIGSIINKYYDLRDTGDFEAAYELLEENKSLLKPYHINANSFNKIELGIYELAKRQFYSQRIIFSDTEPNPEKYEMNTGSEWLQEYE